MGGQHVTYVATLKIGKKRIPFYDRIVNSWNEQTIFDVYSSLSDWLHSTFVSTSFSCHDMCLSHQSQHSWLSEYLTHSQPLEKLKLFVLFSNHMQTYLISVLVYVFTYASRCKDGKSVGFQMTFQKYCFS